MKKPVKLDDLVVEAHETEAPELAETVELRVTVLIENRELLSRFGREGEPIVSLVENALWDAIDPEETGFDVITVEEMDDDDDTLAGEL
jgi:hypothetical protein